MLAVAAAEGPEVKHDDLPAKLGELEGLRVDPLLVGPLFELGGSRLESRRLLGGGN
jgi:hypothetical protein